MWCLVTNMHIESFILETALCKIHDLVSNTYHGKASILVLLDLSAAFDTVDYQLLLSDFSDCEVEGTALAFLESYLDNREQCVAIGESRSEPTALQYGVPHGYVLGPVLFTVYTGTLAFLLEAQELVITFLQMTCSCTSRLKILKKPNIGFHLSCLT